MYYLGQKITKEILKSQTLKPTSQLTNPLFKNRYSFIHQYQQLGQQVLEDDLNLRFKNKNSNKLFHQPAYGFAWVARKDFMNQYQLYDRAILGGSDILLAYALVNGVNILTETYHSVGWGFYTQNKTFTDWYQNITSITQDQVSFVEGSLVHLFHGNLENRQYLSRINGALEYNLNLDRDIVHTQEGLWEFRKQDTKASFNNYFHRYLKSRQEDVG
ncbi:MAG: hypothetical protein AB4058_03815 [Microcystaceae cyanobacterium]